MRNIIKQLLIIIWTVGINSLSYYKHTVIYCYKNWLSSARTLNSFSLEFAVRMKVSYFDFHVGLINIIIVAMYWPN